MVNFNRLVLRPAMTAFQRPMTVYPIVSIPGAPSYSARCIWDIKNIDVHLMGSSSSDDIGGGSGGVLSSYIIRAGIKLDEFATPPAPGDKLDIPAYQGQPAVGKVLVDDSDPDGYGGATLTLKKVLI
jgi:hypothetical protein